MLLRLGLNHSVITLLLLAVACFQVSFLDAIVPLGTVLVAISFAIGNTVKEVVESLVFILGVRPYDVGDRITVNSGPTLIVRKIDIMTTTAINLNNKVRQA